MDVLALDIGGANLKCADGRGFAASQSFPLWRRRGELSAALAGLIAHAPTANQLAVTMTGELADCYRTKAEGVSHILDAVVLASAGRTTSVYLTAGTFATPDMARHRPLEAAASNWHALATFAGRFSPSGTGLLIDIGSTTTDIVPLVDGRVAAQAATDPERLAAGELVYTGVVRSPVSAMVQSIRWRGSPCPVAQEHFATSGDAYVVLDDLPEDETDVDTADGRPATREFAHERIARSICADRDMYSIADAVAAAESIQQVQLKQLNGAINHVASRLNSPPTTIVISGRGEFLARRLAAGFAPRAQLVSLADRLGGEVSRCATAHALAVLLREASDG